MFARVLVSQLVERLNEQRRFIQIVAGPRQNDGMILGYIFDHPQKVR
jgi:hypothetical protein